MPYKYKTEFNLTTRALQIDNRRDARAVLGPFVTLEVAKVGYSSAVLENAPRGEFFSLF